MLVVGAGGGPVCCAYGAPVVRWLCFSWLLWRSRCRLCRDSQRKLVLAGRTMRFCKEKVALEQAALASEAGLAHLALLPSVGDVAEQLPLTLRVRAVQEPGAVARGFAVRSLCFTAVARAYDWLDRGFPHASTSPRRYKL